MRVLLSILLLSVFCLPTNGQTLFSRPYEPNQVSIESIVPDADDASGLTGATFITGTASLTPSIELTAELPLARDGSVSGSSASAIGNPFLGVGLSSTNVPFLVELGARLPTAPNNRGAAVGGNAAFGRTSAFGPDELVLSSLFNGRREVGRHTTLRLRTGMLYATRESASGNRSRDWQLQYETQIWREGDRFITGLSFTGEALLTSPGTTDHHATISMMSNWNRVQPGILFGTALNPLFQRTELVPHVGLTLSVSYGRF